MYGGLDSQLFLGNREWYILDEGRELNKPVIMKQKKEDDQKNRTNRTNRRPSDIQDNLIDSDNVVGLMGDDEDIQQAQYNVMSMIDERLDEYNSDIKEKLNTSINNRLTEIENLMGRLKEDRDNNFEEINELRRISELQTGIMSNMGMIIDDESQPGLQQDLNRLDGLVFSQYQRDSGDLNLSSPTIPSVSSPGESPVFYGKKPGKTYYQTRKENDPKDLFKYKKYTEFPYFLNIDPKNFKDPEDGSYDKFECNKGDNSICGVQHPGATSPSVLTCLPSKKTDEKGDFYQNTNPQKPFTSNDKNIGKCDLEWDPSTNTYLCENWFSQNYSLTDSLNPTPMIDNDYRECIPNLIFEGKGGKDGYGYGDYHAEKNLHFGLVIFIEILILIILIIKTDVFEYNDIFPFVATIVVSGLISYFIFYSKSGEEIYDYLFSTGINGTSVYDKINVAFNVDNPPNPKNDNRERHAYWGCSIGLFVFITGIMTYIIHTTIS